MPVEYTNSIGMKFRLIPPGEFTMGSTDAEIEAHLKDVDPVNVHWQNCLKSEAPQHTVILTRATYLGVTEVTQKDYEALMGNNPSHFSTTGPGKEAVVSLDTARHPVELVSWSDAAEFCAKLSQREKLAPRYSRVGETIAHLNGTGYRLPTEAEWEFACRAGTTTMFWIGNDEQNLVRAAWLGMNSGDRTHGVGELERNPFGLHDIHGNVWEWVEDTLDSSYYGQFTKKPAIDPIGPRSSGSQLHLIRGGDWGNPSALYSRSSTRLAQGPQYRYKTIGFRVSLPVDAVKATMREATSSTSKLEPFPPTFKNTLGMEFVIVPKGKSWLGGGKDKLGDREVEIPADFYLGKYEVTQEEWEKVMGENPSHFSHSGEGKDAVKDIPDGDLKRFPVESVSWDQCQIFVAKLNEREKETGWVYRLPSEVEWEYASRGGPMANKLDSAFEFYLAKPTNTLSRDQGNFGRHLNRTCKVGLYEPNLLGLFNMHDNVWEWCDGYRTAADGTGRRPLRSASWQHPASRGATSNYAHIPDTRLNDTGLRLARVPAGAPSPEAKTPPVAVAPFTADNAKAHQEAWAKHLGVPVEFKNELGMTFRLIPPGEFQMGIDAKDVDTTKWKVPEEWPANFLGDFWPKAVAGASPKHPVRLTRAFYMQTHEVRHGWYKKVLGDNPEFDPAEKADDPVCRFVSWNDAIAFCNALSKQEGKRPCYAVDGDDVTLTQDGNGYRLPTEAEWEFACRAGTQTPWFFGNSPVEPDKFVYRPYQSKWNKTTNPKPNPFGLIDMYGGSTEWVWDGHEEYRPDSVVDPVVAPGRKVRISRGSTNYDHGGSAFWTANSFYRQVEASSDKRHGFRGFGRVVISIPLDKADRQSFQPKVGIAPFTETDVKRIAALSAAEQVEEVRKELKRRNPEFDGPLTPTFDGDAVTGIEFISNRVQDISPIRAFTRLSTLNCRGEALIPGRLADLSPLKGMKLTQLTCSVTDVSDLTPLKDMPLTHLHFDNSPVTSLAPLEGMPLKVLNCSYTRVSNLMPLIGKSLIILWANNSEIDDLSHLKGMPLEWITFHATKVKDISVLKGMPLTQIYLDYEAKRDREVLRSLNKLEKINDKAPAEFWKDVEKPTGFVPFPEAEVKRIAALPVAEQIEEVRKELKNRNPRFDGTLAHTMQGNVVTTLAFNSEEVADIAPVRALTGLKALTCEGRDGNGKLADLSPLKGMALQSLNCSGNSITDLAPLRELPLTSLICRTKGVLNLTPLKGMKLTTLECGLSGVSDLTPLKDMKLTRLVLDHSPVMDLSPLQGMPLTYLHFAGSQMISDLSPLMGMKLTHLYCNDTRVTDLSPLKEMPLKDLSCDFKPERDAAVLRPIKSLEIINNKPAAEFWKEVEKK